MTPNRFHSPFWKNPVIIKEVRIRMRGYRAVLLLTAHLLVLALVVGLAYLFIRSSLTTIGNLEQRRAFGKASFGLIVWMELVMISFVAPALTSGAISIERERQTFDLLRVTLLPARSLVWGKYISGLIFVFLLLFTSIPLQGPAFLIGGVQVQEILLAILMLAVTAAWFCALGMLLSSLIPRTLVSATLAYAVTIFLVFGIPIIAVIIGSLFGTLLGGNTPSQILSPNSGAADRHRLGGGFVYANGQHGWYRSDPAGPAQYINGRNPFEQRRKNVPALPLVALCDLLPAFQSGGDLVEHPARQTERNRTGSPAG